MFKKQKEKGNKFEEEEPKLEIKDYKNTNILNNYTK